MLAEERAQGPEPQEAPRARPLAAALPLPRTSRLALAAFLLVWAPPLSVWLAIVALPDLFHSLPRPIHTIFIGITGAAGVVCGMLALGRMRRGLGAVSGALLARLAILAGATEMALAGVFTMNLGWIGMVGAGLAALLILYALWPWAGEPRETTALLAGCARNLWQLGQAVRLYARDHGGRLPDAAAWCDALADYLPGTDVFQCPGAPGQACAYGFNRTLGGALTAEVEAPAETVVLFEAAGGWNAAGDRSLLPPVPRHMDGYCVLLLDGRVARLTESEIDRLRWGHAPNSELNRVEESTGRREGARSEQGAGTGCRDPRGTSPPG